MMRRLAIALLAMTLSASPFARLADFYGSFWAQEPEATVDRLMREMSTEEIVSQLFIVSWPGSKPGEELLRWITQRNIGGIKIFGWNAKEPRVLAETISTMQEAALASPHAIPLLTATDQEGGMVRHVKGSTSVTPGNLAIGATGLPYDAFESARLIGNELRALGINMNFAPTVDVYSNPKAEVIGPRSFSEKPQQVGTLGMAYHKGLEQQGVIATAKHFPGHGNATGDSHGTLPTVSGSFEELWNRDLLPYRIMIPEGLPAIMTGHLAFPDITGRAIPASVSRYFVHEVLREQLGFDGIVLTDDLYMDGATSYGEATGWSFAELCLQALKAGNDMIMLSETPELNGDIWTTVLREYTRNESFKRRVRESVRRILRTKVEYLRPTDRVPLFPDPIQVARHLPSPTAREFFLDQAARSVTVIRDEHLPFRPSTEERVLLASHDELFLEEGKKRYPNADTFLFDNDSLYLSTARDRRRFRQTSARYDVVIYNLADQNSYEVLRAAAGTEAEIIVVSSLTPVYLRDVEGISTAVAIYGWGTESYRAGFSVLRGDFKAEGTLPVSLTDEEQQS